MVKSKPRSYSHCKMLIVSSLLIFASISANSQNLNLGVRIQKTQGMYWENGVSAQYSFANFKPDRFIAGFDIISSRLGTAMNSNAIKQESYLLSGTWLFNKTKQYHIHARLNMGYFYSDLEYEIFDEIPNTSFLLSPELGLRYEFEKYPVILNLGSGYYVATAEDGYSPGTLQPLYFHFDILYSIKKNKGNE